MWFWRELSLKKVNPKGVRIIASHFWRCSIVAKKAFGATDRRSPRAAGGSASHHYRSSGSPNGIKGGFGSRKDSRATKGEDIGLPAISKDISMVVWAIVEATLEWLPQGKALEGEDFDVYFILLLVY